MRRSVAAAAAVLSTAALGSCSGPSAPGVGPGGTGPNHPAASGGSASPTPQRACPTRYAEPDPNRPRITLDLAVSADLGTVTGTELVHLWPDLPVSEMVFRLTANGPTSFPTGTSVTVQRASAAAGDSVPGRSAPEPGAFRFEPAGAARGSQGGVLVIPLPGRVPAGQEVTAEVGFTLRLASAGFERFGRSGGVAWFGSGQPLLAWERGVGWHREDLARYIGESATSEAARLDLTVTAPASATVLTTGVQDPPAGAGAGRRRWHATSATARDLSVAVGALHTVRATVSGTRLTVGAPDVAAAQATLAEERRAVTALARRFGPFPFPALNVTVLPPSGGGIEYPGSILLYGGSQYVDVHETAHQWFYGLVGNAQSRDPWLDEAFATYAEGLVDGQQSPAPASLPGNVGEGINDFPTAGAYYATVYTKGAAALAEARRRAGAGRFDAAVRCYVNANAWRIARPADVAAALRGLPAALAVLRQAHAVR
jgi:hypothetical protein